MKTLNLDNVQLEFWPTPKLRGVGFYSDSNIYTEVLSYGSQVNFFTKSDLKELLVNNVRGLTYKEFISDTAIENLVKELVSFKWIENYKKSDSESLLALEKAVGLSQIFCVTEEGKSSLEIANRDLNLFFDSIIKKLYDLYIIPGWFIQRLWDLNPNGQGLIVVPTPMKDWNPNTRKWEDNEWTDELSKQVSICHEIITSKLNSAFPIDIDSWSVEVKRVWNNLGGAKPRIRNLDILSRNSYTPRKRLALSMKEATVRLLFANLNPRTKKNDFNLNKDPLLPRTFTYWCTRLEELGMLNYTDFNTLIPGRIIYPVCSFNPRTNMNNFRELAGVSNLQKRNLILHRPKWDNTERLFLVTLFEEYQKIYNKTRSLYVSVQDLRDEVCRILKLSSFMFNKFLERGLMDSLDGNSNYRISIETDIREDQRNAFQMQRKPVYSRGKIISLIAITKQ